MKLWLFLLVSGSFFANNIPMPPDPGECPAPWFTGPLLTPSSHVVPKGYYNIEPYGFYTVNTGFYNNDWKEISSPNFTDVSFLSLFYVGLTEWMEFLVVPKFAWQYTQEKANWVFNDLTAHVGFQLLHDTKTNSLPGIKFYIRENFPTGKYQKSNPSKLTTDIGGDGSYETTIGFVIGRMFELWDCHYLSLRFNAFGTFPTKVSVKGINAFGGAPNTDARIKIGNHYASLFGLEYSFNQNWVFAFDLEGSYQRPITYRGFPGTLADKSPAPLGKGEAFQFSAAPAIEYNFSSGLGLIGGVWWSFAGKNDPRFISGVIALNYYAPIKGSAHKYRTSGGSGGSSGGGR